LGKNDGHILFDHAETSIEDLSDVILKGIDYSGKIIQLSLGSDKDKDFFMKDHGRYVEKTIKKKLGKKLGKPLKNKSGIFKGTIKFAD
jgi:hypothetical protein